MTTNAFEKPIAANPISKFVELPLQYIDQALERKQQKYDMNKAKVAAAEDLWLNTKARSVDMQRHQEILAEKDAEMDMAIDQMDGDYGRLGGYMDKLERDLRRELKTGELGTINQNYERAAKFKEDLETRRAEGTISDAGYALGLSSLQGGRTEQLETGDWSKFQGYTPQKYYDVNKALIEYSKNIKDQYSADGTLTYMTKKRAAGFIFDQAKSDPKLIGALTEDLQARGITPNEKNIMTLIAQKTDPVAGKLAFAKNDQLKKLQLQKAKEENSTVMIAGGLATAPKINGTGGTYKGGAGGWVADKWRKIRGANNDEFEAWRKSKDGKALEKRYETYYGTKTLSDDPYEAMAQIDEFASKLKDESTKINQIETFTDINKLKRVEGMVINPYNGKLRVTSDAVFDSEGQKVDPEDIGGLEENGKPTIALVGTVKGTHGSYPPGTTVITDGEEQYYILPNRKDEISSADGAIWQINNTKFNVDGSGSMKLSGNASKFLGVPSGEYKVSRSKVKVKKQDGANTEVPAVILQGQGKTKVLIETATGYRELNKS